MPHCRISLVVALAVSLDGSSFAQAPPRPTIDETYLKDRGLKTDAASLFALLGNQIGVQSHDRDLGELIAHLGDPVFAKRERATQQLIAVGPAALKALRDSDGVDDPEIRSGIQRYIATIEARQDKTLGYYAVRHLLRTRPPGVAEVVCAYLAVADADTVAEIWCGMDVIARDGKIDAAVGTALNDAEPRRRALAAFLLGRYSTDADRAKVRERLKDDNSEVCLRSAHGLLGSRDRSSIPALIELLRHTQLEVAWQAEELLHWIAGPDSPPATIGTGSVKQRQKCQVAWKVWWHNAGRTSIGQVWSVCLDDRAFC
jgi:hypothetical protein